VDRWASLLDFTFKQFPHIILSSPMEIYILPYPVYEKRLDRRYPGTVRQQEDGQGLTLADTWRLGGKDMPGIIESFLIMDDVLLIHEALHHILPIISWATIDHRILEVIIINLETSEQYKEWLRAEPWLVGSDILPAQSATPDTIGREPHNPLEPSAAEGLSPKELEALPLLSPTPIESGIE